MKVCPGGVDWFEFVNNGFRIGRKYVSGICSMLGGASFANGV